MTSSPLSLAIHEANLPKVSVIVPIYNGEADLPELMACLQAQTYPRERVEYLLVDNNSRDRTASLLQTSAAALQAGGVHLRPLSEKQIQSSYAARNTGIRAAIGEIVVFTDADCRPLPGWLMALVQPFADAAVGLVVGEIQALSGQTLLEQYADRQDTLSQKHTLAHSFCPYGQTANLAVRYEVLKEVGLFRPYLTTGGDADFCWRILRQTTWQYAFAEQAIVQHRHRTTLKEFQSQWRRYGTSNRYLHELHGVALMRDITWQEVSYRLSRWVLKELPIATGKILAGKATLVDLVNTPIGLLSSWHRASGQRNTKLPVEAKQIVQLEDEGSIKLQNDEHTNPRRS
ncbi:MAG: glycosyltransferase [Scytolyngbya sp. HA4215-MV1]|jgi:cellulose synthase/poly-beta-1,6-N-acetylglucosamine synthase-like glycosyltransferase|nr:glycosyltransferase [Scytolyngbya sp. HA4215-MV1]